MILKDNFNRTIDYIRISITDMCNFRCGYCMPPEGIKLKPHKDILSYESIASITHVAGKLGIKKVRLTGGEPLVRKDIVSLVEMIKLSGNFDEINMTTNGSLLDLDTAKSLKKQGLTRINISLDTLDREHFKKITRTGDIDKVFAGIDNAIQSELTPIKLNMVVFKDTSEKEINDMLEFCNHKKIRLQTIKHFSLNKRYDHEIAFDRPKPCSSCNRLRLTSDGYLKSCLFSENEVKVDLNNIEDSILRAVNEKAEKGSFCQNRSMLQIGG